jgi:dihydroorotate dehydrogenase (NAD+) catalytic subunit
VRAKAVSIPVIGCGGIVTAEDAVEYLLVGACAVQIGMTTFVRPRAMLDIIAGLKDFAARRGISQISELIGAIQDHQSKPITTAMVPT